MEIIEGGPGNSRSTVRDVGIFLGDNEPGMGNCEEQEMCFT